MGGAQGTVAAAHALGKPRSIPIFQTAFIYLKSHFGISTVVSIQGNKGEPQNFSQ